LLDQAVEHAMKVREDRPWRLRGYPVIRNDRKILPS
jgi:hypothetical protein